MNLNHFFKIKYPNKQSENINKLTENNKNLQEEIERLNSENNHLKEKIKKDKEEYSLSLNKMFSELDRSEIGYALKDKQRIQDFLEFNHELINPLNISINYVDEFLLKQPETKEITCVKKILDRLISEVSSCLEEERLNLGLKIYDHNQITNLSNIILGLSEVYKPVILNKGNNFNVKVQESLYIKAAPQAIEKIMTNLLENAIKFTPENGNITISLELRNKKICLSVKDDGVGIPEKDTEHIFKPFYRLNTKDGYKGYGLGLSLVYKLVEDLKGQIEVKSELNKGTEFIIEIDNCELSPNDIIPEYDFTSDILPDRFSEVNDIIQNEQCETIFIVDNNCGMLHYLRDKLRGRYNVYFAKNGNHALQKLEELSIVPDLIISDIMMEKMDGLKFKEILNSGKEFRHIPFIFLSGKSFYTDKLNGMERGSIDYLYKPFKWPELKIKIEAILANARAQKERFINSIGKSKTAEKNFEQLKSERFELNCKKYELTNKEKLVMESVMKKHKNKEIAEGMNISVNTVSKHIRNTYEKLGVTSKVEAMEKLYS